MIRRLFDISNYQERPPREFFEKLRAAGYDAMIPGCQRPAYTGHQIDMALSVGIEVPAVYQMQYWDDEDDDRLSAALQFDRPVWVDCETPNRGFGPSALVERIQQGKDFLLSHGKYAGIYTGGWWWKPNTANSWHFKDDPLWAAYYINQEPSSDFHEFEAAWFGGWARPTIFQWTSEGGALLGLDRHADLNLWNAPAPPPAPGITDSWEDVMWAAVAVAQHYRHGTNPHPDDKARFLRVADKFR